MPKYKFPEYEFNTAGARLRVSDAQVGSLADGITLEYLESLRAELLYWLEDVNEEISIRKDSGDELA